MNGMAVFSIVMIAFITITIVGVILTYVNEPVSTRTMASSGGVCGKGCGAIDPVGDPKYNMKNIIKQSILLEEHLIEDNKYCKDCCVKHFMHIIGLAEEALCLAGANWEQYPLLKESIALYNALFDRWLANVNDETVRREVAASLRDQRKLLVQKYLLSAL